MPNNICQYRPLTTVSRKEIDARFKKIHDYLCYVGAALSGLTTSTTTTTTTTA